MKEVLLIIVFSCFLMLLELAYFRVAKRFGIIDQPNQRSSHKITTIRGGGIIFSLSVLLYYMLADKYEVWFLTGLLLISIISFVDDIKPRNYKVRMLIHLLAVFLMFVQLSLLDFPYYIILIALFFVIGTINAVNFMDGINGITGVYGLITLCTLWYVNHSVTMFISPEFMIAIILGLLLFLFFNFRKKAVCFAGDVGSVSLAFILVFLILSLVIVTHNVGYILFLLVYGLDVVTTIVFRIIRRENIAQAHRTHFYQFLANEKNMSHLIVTLIYATIQLTVNIIILYYKINVISDIILIIITAGILFVIIRFIFEGSNKLLTGIKND